jgi:hypothetical protein
LPRDRYRYAFMLNFNKRDGKAGVAYKENGNVANAYPVLPPGLNTCIGAKEHVINGSIIYLVHNASGNHGIYEYFPDTDTVEAILINDILNFSLDRRIHSINIFDDNLTYTDDLAPKHIIISSAKAHTAGTGSTADVFAYDNLINTGTDEQRAQFITAGAYPPLFPPVAESVVFGIGPPNNFSLHQFRYRYVYFDNTKSTFGPINQVLITVGDETYKSVDNLYLDNAVKVTFNSGHPTVKTIQIATKRFDSSWSVIGEIDKYNISNNRLINDYSDIDFNWTGEELFTVPDNELINYYSIPLKSFSQELSYNNYLFYGNYVTGFDPIDINATLSLSYRDFNLDAYTGRYDKIPNGPYGGTSNRFQIALEAYYSSTRSSFLWIKFIPKIGGDIQYIGADFGGATIEDALTALALSINTQASALSDINIFVHYEAVTHKIIYDEASSAYNISLAFIDDVSDIKKFKAYRSISSHSFGVVYFDELGRHSGVSKLSELEIPKTSNIPIVNISISSNAPSWAKTYQIVHAESSVSYMINISSNAFSPFVINESMYSSFSVVKMYDNIVNFSGIEYSFEEGDYLVWRSNGEEIKVRIISYDPSTKSIVTDFFGRSARNATGISNLRIERYKSTEDIIYQEMGEVRSVFNGLHEGDSQTQTASLPAIIELTSGDSYWQLDPNLEEVFLSSNVTGNTGAYLTETVYYSKFYSSTYNDSGRLHVYDEDIKQVNLSNHFIYGGRYFEDTKTNRLFEFSSNNDNSVSSEDGPIQRLVSMQYTIKILQDKKISSAYLNRQIAVNPGGSDSVVLSDKFVGEIRPYPMEMGTQHPESVVLNNRYLYMWDARNGFAIRDDANGPDIISQANFMTGSRRLSDEYHNGRIFGAYDDSRDQVIWTFGDTNKSETVVYEQSAQLWRGFTPYYPEHFISIGMVFISFKNGVVWVHNDEVNQGSLYGDTYDSVIETVFNENPTNTKTALAIAVHSNKRWSAPNKGDISTEDTDMYGTQETRILANKFEYQDRVFHAAVPRDMNTPNTLNPVINGDKLQGSIFKVRLTNGDLGETKIFAIDLNYLNNTTI